MSMHQPIRPDWICAGCGATWPCRTRQHQLIAQYHRAPISLMIYLSGFFIEASQDMPHTAAGTLHRRFLGWPAHVSADHWRNGTNPDHEPHYAEDRDLAQHVMRPQITSADT